MLARLRQMAPRLLLRVRRDRIATLTYGQKQQLDQDGFLLVRSPVLDVHTIEEFKLCFDKCFRAEFETGVEPDYRNRFDETRIESTVTGELSNAWKCDLTIASVTLSKVLAQRAAFLAGWDGVRIAQDDMWYKWPSGATRINFHQDGPYISHNFEPPRMIVCWIPLDDTAPSIGGALWYVRGSHRWTSQLQESNKVYSFHNPANSDPLEPVRHAAARAGIDSRTIETVPAELPAGACAYHFGETWHGSDPVLPGAATRGRRALSISYLPWNVRFTASKPRAEYIYGRYQSFEPSRKYDVSEDFFPILWRVDGYRTPFLHNYCKDRLEEQRKSI